MKNIRAKPTKYNGVLFRSKSEAKLAVCLDAWKTPWEYEPDVEHEHWKPDFLFCIDIQWKSKDLRVGYLIEYKPILPNQNYISELSRHFNAIFNSEDEVKSFLNVDALFYELWCIDFWNKKRIGIQFRGSGKTKESMIIEKLSLDPGCQFRFDLAR